MQEAVYHSNFEIEENYFWFLARNKIVSKIIENKTGLQPGYQVLDVGCGTGGFAKIMSEKYQVACIDTEPLAIEYCRERGLTDLHNCYLNEFDASGRNIKAVVMLDVVEHIENDREVVAQVYDMLPKGGWFIATVPAYQWLWSHHDIMHMHFRRYTKSNFIELLSNAGFQINYSSYFNSFLFLPAVAKRFMDKFSNDKEIQNRPPVDEVSPFLNNIFTKIFSSESMLLPSISLPFGLSIIVVSQK